MRCAALILSCALAAAADLPPLVPGTLEWDWVGNSYSEFSPDAENGVGRWVQNFIDELEVAPDGTVIVGCDWDEGGRCLALYRSSDGMPNGSCLGKRDRQGGHRNCGWGTSTSAMTVSGNEIICASNDGDFYRFNWTPGEVDSGRFANSFGNGFGDAVNDPKATKVIALNAKAGRIALLLADGRVQVRRQDDWQIEQSFSVPGAHDLCWGADGTLWLVAEGLREVTPTGVATGRLITDAGRPSAVALAPDGRLVVCDDGPRQQVRFYDLSGANARLLSVFGQEGGIRAGTPGDPQPDKLMRPAGANCDAAGNLYVGLRYDELSPTGGLILRSFDPKGKLRWEKACHVFSECLDVVEAHGALTAYGFRSTFVKRPGAARGDWALDAITLDSRNQLEDPRYRKALLQATAVMRELDGQRYVFTWGSGGNSALEITRLDAEGRLAAHVATIGTPGPWAFDVDARGDVWCDDNHTAMLRRRHLGGGRWGEAERFPLPETMTEIERIAYDAGNDVLYVSGYTADIVKPNGEWGLMGRALLRVDGYTAGKPVLRWTAGVLLDDDGLPPKAMALAGDYLFTAACKPTHGLRGQIYVYRTSDGGFVGRISAPLEIAQNTGWIDLSHGIRARVAQDGRYLITQEDNLRAKVILHTWTPPR